MAEEKGAANSGQSSNVDVQKTGVQRSQSRVPSYWDPRPPSWAASPFAFMRQFSRDLDRLFGGGFGGAPGFESPTPQIEVLERGDELVVRADLPGLDKKDVTVEVADGMLTISGERRSEHDETRQGVRVSERQYGHFMRRVPLPEGLSGENARATFENGVLEVTMPAPAGHQKGRRIEIQEGHGAKA